MKRYKVKEVMEILDIKKSRIQYYYDTGVIVPLEDSKGPGTNRYFSVRNIAEIYLAMTLTKLGIGIRVNAAVIQGLKNVEKDIEKSMIEDGELKEGESYSPIEPGTLDGAEVVYLTLDFSSEDDPTPNIDITAMPYDLEEGMSFPLPIDPNDSHFLMINLSRIKMIVENKMQ